MTYDDCSVTPFQNLANGEDGLPLDTADVLSTNWTMVYRFNAIFYMILTVMIALSCFGLMYTQIFGGTIACIQVGQCVNLALIIVTGVYSFNAAG